MFINWHKAGGRLAAKEFSTRAKDYMKTLALSTENTEVVVRIYGNVKHLKVALFSNQTMTSGDSLYQLVELYDNPIDFAISQSPTLRAFYSVLPPQAYQVTSRNPQSRKLFLQMWNRQQKAEYDFQRTILRSSPTIGMSVPRGFIGMSWKTRL